MSPCLDTLPYDILFTISLSLDIEDIVHLKSTCWQLRYALGDESVSKRLLENCASGTLEARHASDRQYESAVQRIYKRRAAMAAGRPVSITSLGYAADVVYGDGVMCYAHQHDVRIVDLQTSGDSISIPITQMLPPEMTRDTFYDCNAIRLLNYSSCVLTILFEDDSNHKWLVAVKITEDAFADVLMTKRLGSTNKLFVRNTADVLFYGTHSAYGARQFREWIVQAMPLNGRRISSKEAGTMVHKEGYKGEVIQLSNFAGSDIGSTVCFRIHDGHFYALTNCDAFDAVEIDFTSFYHCIRFPVDDARTATCQANPRIFRRQHEDGPIIDGWNSLDLQVDERTGELMIVEGRAEWSSDSGTVSRGYHTRRLSFDVSSEAQECPTQVGPAGNPLSSIPGEDTKYCPTPHLDEWQRHLEDQNERVSPKARFKEALKFPLARTRFRCYNLTSQVAFDLVESSCDCTGADNYCLKLRSFCRTPMSFQAANAVPTFVPTVGSDPESEDDCAPAHNFPRIHGRDFRYDPIKIWPHGDHSKHEDMSLPRQDQHRGGVEVKAWADERCIIYFLCSGGMGKIVYLTFDGDAPVARLRSILKRPQLQIRGRPQQAYSYPEHLRQLSPDRQPFEVPCFEPDEVKEDWLVTTRDLDDVPNAECIRQQDLDEWFDSFDPGHGEIVDALGALDMQISPSKAHNNIRRMSGL